MHEKGKMTFEDKVPSHLPKEVLITKFDVYLDYLKNIKTEM